MVNWKENNYPFKKFTEELTQEWINVGFNKRQTREWLEIGLQPTDANFAHWLRSIKNKDSEWFSECNDEEDLRKEYEKNLKNENNLFELNKKETSISQAQSWLDKNYPREERNLISYLNIKQKDLIGSLDLSDFTNLESIFCSHNKLTSLKINNSISLRLLDCSDNQLNQLIFTNVNQLKQAQIVINISDNLLTNLDFLSTLDPKKITELIISDNNISDRDISIFSHFTNLEELHIGNVNLERIRSKIYNRFYGSLDSFKDLKKLKTIEISDVDIDSGVGCLSKSITNIHCTSSTEKESRVEKIKEELKTFLEINLLERIILLTPLPSINFFEKTISQKIYHKIKELEIIEEEFKFNGSLLKQEFITKVIEKLIPYEELRNNYLKYRLCQDCYQPNNLLGFCQKCSIEKLKKLIPYEEFTELQEIGGGGFSTVYKAEWKGINVILKVLYDKLNKEEFLRELANYQMFKKDGTIASCFGITQDPAGNYAIVLMYFSDGDLRNYLCRHNDKDVSEKTQYLWIIANSLNTIHKKGLIHKDFHLGNILMWNKSICTISDLGLSSAVYEGKNNEIRGVLPYVAPEILMGGKHTKETDIYSFGMMMYEVLTGYFPFHNQNWNDLSFQKAIVFEDLRPEINVKLIPQLEKMIKDCWVSNPDNRPTAKELSEKLLELYENKGYHNLLNSLEYNHPYQKNFLINPSICLTSKWWKMIDKPTNISNEVNFKLNEEKQTEILLLKSRLNSLQDSLESTQKSLIDQFITLRQKFLVDENSEQIVSDLKKLERQIKKDSRLKEIIGEIKNICGEIFELEQENKNQFIGQIEQSRI